MLDLQQHGQKQGTVGHLNDIYNLPISFAQTLEAVCTKFLKKWLGLTKTITNSVLYRSKHDFGLINIKQITDLYLQDFTGIQSPHAKDVCTLQTPN